MTLAKSLPSASSLWDVQDVTQRIYHGDLKVSCRLTVRGMPSTPSKPSSSECLGSLIDKDVCKPADDNNINKSCLKTSRHYTRERMWAPESIPSAISLVLWRRKVPESIVTNPQISVTTCVGLCPSQSWYQIQYSIKYQWTGI